MVINMVPIVMSPSLQRGLFEEEKKRIRGRKF